MPAVAVIQIWDDGNNDLPTWTYETDDPQIISLMHGIFREDDLENSQPREQQNQPSVMQQPLVTRMEPI